MKIGREKKLRGEEKLNYLSAYLHCLLLFSQKISRSLRSLDYILFSSPSQGMRNIYGRGGKVRLTFKSAMEKRSIFNTELYTLSCTGRQSCREQDN